MKTTVGPFWHYLGSKFKLSRLLPAPRYDLIIEPFAGSAGYACNYPDRDILLIDNSPGIVSVWKWLIQAAPSDILAIPVLSYGERIDTLDIPNEAKIMLSFFSVPGDLGYAKTSVFSSWSAKKRASLAQDVTKIRHWKVEQGNYSCAPDIEATWIIDPPYERVLARYHGGSNAAISFPSLSRWCLSRKGQVVVHEQAGPTWLPFQPLADVQAASRGGKNARGKSFRSQEVVWSNDAEFLEKLAR